MASPAEHYDKAENAIAAGVKLAKMYRENPSAYNVEEFYRGQQALLAKAQVHATLATCEWRLQEGTTS